MPLYPPPSGGTGTVTNFSSGDLSPLFTTTEANPTTAPALSFALTNAAANSWFGNATGSSAAPAYNASVFPAALMPALTGPVTTTAGGVATTITNAAVTYAKMQNVSANSMLLGSGSAGTGLPPAEITVGSGLTMTGTTLTAAGSSAAGGSVTFKGNIDYTILNTDKIVATNAAFTALHTWTMPAASTVAAGNSISIIDLQATLTTANRLLIVRSGSDTFMPGSWTQINLEKSGQGIQFTSDGVSKWYVTYHSPSTASANGQVSLWDNSAHAWTIAPVAFSFAINASPGAGKIVQSDGTNFNASTPTWPTAASTLNKVLKSDGTNLVMSTETYAVPGAAGQVLRSNATNWLSAALAFSDLSGSATAAQMPAFTGDVTSVAGATANTLVNIPATTTIAGVAGTRGDVLYYGASGWAKLAAGTSGNQLTTNGAGADPTWAAAGSGGGGTPGGSTTQVQYNNASAFGGITGATTDGTTMTLTSPKIGTKIQDTGAGTLLDFTLAGGAGATNYIQVANAGTATAPSFRAAGADTDVSLSLVPKGAGYILVSNNPGAGGRTGIIFNNLIGATDKSCGFFLRSNGTDTWFYGNDSSTNGANDFFFYDNTNNVSRLYLGPNKEVVTPAPALIGWSATTAGFATALDTALARNAAGVVEVNNGTAGTYRDIIARTHNATSGYQINGTAVAADYINSSVSSQSPSTSDVYLTGSNVAVPAGAFAAKGQYRCLFEVTKSAGTGAIVLTLRIGTAGTTSDAAIQTFTFGAGTAVADTGWFEVIVNFRTVGSGTSAVVSGFCRASHNLIATGLFNNATNAMIVGSPSPSSGFASNTATNIGLSFNGSTAFAGTITTVQASLNQ